VKEFCGFHGKNAFWQPYSFVDFVMNQGMQHLETTGIFLYITWHFNRWFSWTKKSM